MLEVVTDLKDTGWLSYIVEEFLRIEKALFEVSIQKVSDQEIKPNASRIFYTTDVRKELCIPNLSGKTALVDSKYASENIFVLENSISDQKGYILNYDLFWNAFSYLTRLEEYEVEKGGKRINSYSNLHPRTDKSTFDIPIVNRLFKQLKEIIQSNFPDLKFETQQAPIVELSHDLDYIKKTAPLRIKQTAFNLFKTIKSVAHPSLFLKNLNRTFQFLFSNPSYWCFDYWQQIETKYGFKSIFYVYSRTSPIGLKKWLLDPSYDVSTNKKLQKCLKKMQEDGFEVGIHGSFNSSESLDQLSKEKIKLEEALNFKIKRGRQHWLRYGESITPIIHEKLLETDSTLGWNDIPGFRAGCCSKFRAYSHEEKRPLNLWIVPQMIMDSHLFDYAVNKHQIVFENGVKLLESLKEYQNAYVSISWHPRTCSSDYNWHYAYEKYLQIIQKL